MPVSPDVNNRSKLNESMITAEGTIDKRVTLGSIFNEEVIVPNGSDFINVCTKDDGSFYSQKNFGEIEDIINADGANVESFVEICNSDAKKTMSNNSSIDHVYNDKTVPEYSQLCLKCGITTNELKNQTELCKATKSFTCSACSFQCCSRHNFEYHMQSDHKISMKCAVTSDSKEIKMSKSMNNSSNEQSSHRFSRTNGNKYIELHCVKCGNISCPTTTRPKKEITCGLCNASVISQCIICKKRYTRPDSIYNHLRYDCLNVDLQYECTQCDYKSNRKTNLKIHVNGKHSNEKCTACGEIFKGTYALKKHKLFKCLNKAMLK